MQIYKQANQWNKKIINNKSLFDKITQTCMLINHVYKNHTDYILKHKKLPIPLFKKEEIVTLTEQPIQAFTWSQIQTLTEKQIQAKIGQIKKFTEQQIPYFTE